ncbi:PREDICTED: E3 ubiquitin-protein ligase TRIM21-like isoform X2 [Poecilia mexicana]|uniref:E3 ubiquitin-protein ligase TRIM21-like isoform X2 n=1 Tax=Poecilia mexicana TaxID=48701 RepID=UPI00072EA5CB|nr:PREDICTED: E3 ubiquitin-protein ligase TRIM21-like isoform X2 [Poecilia mexicana]
MSLQVCHCGWSKCTTYQGLRTHQGKMGCTPKGMHIPENKLVSYFPRSYIQPRLITSVDIFKTPMKFDSSGFEELQVCHCGWSKVTTYHGLRTHQGMMGCTPKGLRIPESNQNFRSNMLEQPYQMDNWSILNTPVKEEKLFISPNLPTQLNYGLTQKLTQDMNQRVVKTEQDSQQMVPTLNTTTIPFGSQTETDASSLSTDLMSSPSSRILLTESDSSIFQTPQPFRHGFLSSDNACRRLDFSSACLMADSDSEIETNTHKDAVTVKKTERGAEKLLQAQQDRMKVLLQQKIHIREQKMTEVRSAVKSCKGSLDDEWMQIHSVFSEVMKVVEDARKKALEPIEKRRRKVKRDEQNLLQKLQGEIDRLRDSIDKLDRSQDLQAFPPSNLDGSKEIKDLKVDTSFSFGTLKATTSTMMKDIQWRLENLSSLELKRITTFAVDVKLDSATAHHCLILSNDGKTVRDGGEKPKAPDDPERFDTFGSVLGINCLNRGRAYWEVEVKNKSGWDLGVARRSANRKGLLKVNTDNGYWVAVHFKDRKYAALTVPPTSLPLSEKPQKVGVFVDYEEGVVSFYDVMNKSHIFSFTECLFNDDILPYFSPHPKMNDKNVDPLIISVV